MPALSLTARQTLTLGRTTMLASLLVMIGAILVTYPFSAHFSLVMQIIGHIALPVAAAFFKLGYVARLAAHHALGNLSAG
ncbi:hypothetical protein [Azoarcus sp. KH32C]|uniref:hypothetical protein n=1 Tax=Azoarcus sp. KH32C TaxID=748247 RepID=UPI0002386FE8|nr:hypothetical protein [Azoarcus sp. KH32C]BAL23965.1 hypothetical protein AZKH_1649 [Azoarcus sp. KH32C]